MRGTTSEGLAWKYKLLVAAVAFVLLGLTLNTRTHAAKEDEGQAIFQAKCKACHTIGGGRTVGPDLKGVTAIRDRTWLARFIATPEQLISQGDPLAQQIVKEYGMPMPGVGVSIEDAEKILVYIESQSGGGAPLPTPSVAGTKPTAAASGDAKVGRALFLGQVGMKNGGSACVSCHNAKDVGALGGGNVGKDLSRSYATFGQEGLQSILQTVPFPIMREAYANKTLTPAEIANIIEFLKQTSAQTSQTQAPSAFPFLLVGLVGVLPLLGLFQLFWRGRLRSVRQSLPKGGSK